MFRLAERPLESLPIRITRHVELGAGADAVFDVLADHAGWTGWFRGMRRVHVDGAPAGEGALRTVSVPPAKVQERFSCWEPGRRLTFHVVASSLPGLAAMTEDWRLEPIGPDRTRLTIDVGAAPAPWARLLTPVARFSVARATSGAVGIRTMFPA